jgi:hypothetical protein
MDNRVLGKTVEFPAYERLYRTDYEVPYPAGNIAITTSSDIRNIALIRQHQPRAHGLNPHRPPYTTEAPNLACHIDISTANMDMFDREGWPKLDEARVQLGTSQEFLAQYLTTPQRRPLDGITRLLAFALLHEVSIDHQFQ